MNGVYWEFNIPRLFEMEDLRNNDFRLKTIADISDDRNGSVPCNISDSTIDDPVYGVDKNTLNVTAPYLTSSVDIMAIGNLPNELPRDASRYFGEQLIKYIINDIQIGASVILENATIVKNGKLTKGFEYMREYAGKQ